MAMIPANDFRQEIQDKLRQVYDSNQSTTHGNEIAARMAANFHLWDLQFPEVRQYLRYLLARSDIDWTYVDDSTEA